MCFLSSLIELLITNVGMNEMKVNEINIKVCHGQIFTLLSSSHPLPSWEVPFSNVRTSKMWPVGHFHHVSSFKQMIHIKKTGSRTDSLAQPALISVGQVPQLSVAFLLIEGDQTSRGMRLKDRAWFNRALRFPSNHLSSRGSRFPPVVERMAGGTDTAGFPADLLITHMFLSKREKLACYSENWKMPRFISQFFMKGFIISAAKRVQV